MAIGLRRKVRLDSRRANQKATRRRNGVIKQDERARRDARMLQALAAKPEDCPPVVQSWLSRRLGKRFAAITQDDISQLIA